MFFAVVNRGKANTVLHKAEELGARAATIVLGEGTIPSKFLEKMGIAETHKEILMILGSKELCNTLHDKIGEEFKLYKRNRGMAFSIPFKRWKLNDSEQEQRLPPERKDYSHFCIITIVDKGRGKDCMNVARAAGAKGGTLIHARGAGIPTDFYYPLVIEPQKDFAMIITPKDKLEPIRERITTELEIEKTGNGIIFVLPVLRTSGLVENRFEERRGVSG